MIITCIWFLTIAALIGITRLIIGPAVSDRIVATEVVSIILTLVIVLLSFHFRNSVFLDVALAFSVLSFADVLIMAKYFEHGKLHE